MEELELDRHSAYCLDNDQDIEDWILSYLPLIHSLDRNNYNKV